MPIGEILLGSALAGAIGGAVGGELAGRKAADNFKQLYNILAKQQTVEGGSVITNISNSLFNRNVKPSWSYLPYFTAPAGGSVLIQKDTVATATYIYGFFIAAGEANAFLINWTFAGSIYSRLIPLGGVGAVETIDCVPLNEGQPADKKSVITITNINAGGAGILYQAGLLIGEVN